MRGIVIVLIGFFMIAGSARAAAPLDAFKAFDGASAAAVDHRKWAAFLNAHVRVVERGPNLVAYGAVTAADKTALAAYIAELERISPQKLNRDEAFAFWVNLYNALTVKVILDNYPVSSIRKIKSGPISLGPWGKTVATVDGAALSLNDIEHKILRAHFKDPRVHYAVNCASLGCPDLQPAPWTGAGLEAALDAAARGFVNSKEGVAVRNGKVTASSIFNWYAKDFGADDKAVLAHLARFAEPDLMAKLKTAAKIDRYQYDWTLNEAK